MHSEINLHWLYSPEIALKDAIIFVGYDIILRQMRSSHPPSWISLFFEEVKKNKGCNAMQCKLKPKMPMKCTSSWSAAIWWRKLKKKLIWNSIVARSTSKMMDTHSSNQNFRRERMNSYWKFPFLRVNLLFQNLKTWVAVHPAHIRPRVKLFESVFLWFVSHSQYYKLYYFSKDNNL